MVGDDGPGLSHQRVSMVWGRPTEGGVLGHDESGAVPHRCGLAAERRHRDFQLRRRILQSPDLGRQERSGDARHQCAGRNEERRFHRCQRLPALGICRGEHEVQPARLRCGSRQALPCHGDREGARPGNRLCGEHGDVRAVLWKDDCRVDGGRQRAGGTPFLRGGSLQ
ncbi:hypothetical protein FQZ97_803270 [compost metagenome]